MAKGGIDAQLDRLVALRANPASDAARAELSKALGSKTNLAAAKAADIIAQHKLAGFDKQLVDAFTTFLNGSDKSCHAKLAIAKALATLEQRAEDVFLVGARHVQMEPVWGGSADVAIELRGLCCTALVNLRSRHALVPLTHLLADDDANARASAVRALACYGGDAAEALVRFKMLSGDKDPNVIGECFAAIIELTRSLADVEPFLDSHRDENLREAALLAVGESKLPDAWPRLRKLWDAQVVHRQPDPLLLAIALTRHAEAIELLLSVIASADTKTAADAVAAMALYRADDSIRSKIRVAARERGGAVLASFDDHCSA